MSCKELLKKELRKEFPSIDRDLQIYVESKKVVILVGKWVLKDFGGLLDDIEDLE